MLKAKNVVFLTEYAQAIISKHTGPLNSTSIIPHGLKNNFINVWKNRTKINNPISIIYVSNASYYKHHINVLKAVKEIFKKGIDLKLNLIGANVGAASYDLQQAIKIEGAEKNTLRTTKFMNESEIVDELKNADIGVFASSCENMPNTLVEMMGSGIPIACSNRPMLEVLGTNNFTFNPFKS